MSANEYTLADGFLPPYLYGFVSPAIYAVSKTALARRTLPPVVHFMADAFPPPPYLDDCTSIQPSTSPDTSQAGGVQNGTEYFLSAQGRGGSSVVVWALTKPARWRMRSRI